jgi:signal transduction histidine kinase/ligand-binding sensor domain-containing protein
MLVGAAGLTAALPASPEEVPTADDVVLRVWSLPEGMPDHHVGSITRSTDGYLWVTCLSGLLRFDGDRFVLMGTSAIPGLESRWAAPAFQASDDSLWLGLDRGGMARMKDGAATMILPLQPRPNRLSWPSSFAEDPAGGIWFGYSHESRVYRWHEGQVSTFSWSAGVPHGSWSLVQVAKDGATWVATAGGCFRFNGERFDEVDPGGGGDLRLASSRDGGMWAVRGDHLLRYSDEGGRSDMGRIGWIGEGNRVTCLEEDREGALWIGTGAGGLFRYRDGEIAKVPTSYAQISSLESDAEGNVWVGTWGGGLNRLTSRSFFLRPPLRDGGDTAVRAVCEDSDGRLWLIDGAGRTLIEEDSGRTSFKPVEGWDPSLAALSVCRDPAGGLWFGTSRGLVGWHDGKFHRENFHQRIEAVFMDRAGDLWIATGDSSVFRRHGKGIEPVPTDGGLVQARAMSQDAAGRIWIGTHDGSLFVGEKDAFSQVPLPEAGGDETIRFIVPESDGTVWIGSLVGGLHRWGDGVVQRVPDDAGLPLTEARSLIIEYRGGGSPSGEDLFWLGTANGLFRATRREIERVLTSGSRALGVVRHGVDEGLPPIDFAPGYPGGAVGAGDGHLWLAGNLGVLQIDAVKIRSSPAMGKVVIEEARVGGLLVSQPVPTKKWSIPPKSGALQFRFTLPELRQPEHVRFRYRMLDSEDGDWTEVGKQREVTFARLTPGDYRFEVTGAVADGRWLPAAAAVEFSVLPAWWQTLWFRILLVIASGMAVWWGVMLRMRARIRRLEQERAMERERTRIARDMHDEVGANLTHIAATSRLAMLGPPEETPGFLGEIASIARQTVDSLDEIVWAVNPRYDTLAGAVEYIGKFAVRFVSGAGVACEVDLPEELPSLALTSDVRHHLLLVVKEALNNAVKHSRAGQILVSASLEGSVLSICVIDDGEGFDPGTTAVGADGLRNMRERMAGVGGELGIASEAGRGTRVELRLPLSLSAGRDGRALT